MDFKIERTEKDQLRFERDMARIKITELQAALEASTTALQVCESALAAFLPNHPAGKIAREVLNQKGRLQGRK